MKTGRQRKSAAALVRRYLTFVQPAELLVNVRRSTARQFASPKERGGPLYVGETKIVTLDDRP